MLRKDPRDPGDTTQRSNTVQAMSAVNHQRRTLILITASALAGCGGVSLSGGGIPATESEVSLEFTVTTSHPRVSLVAMVAPSPDWFVGVHDLPLFASNQWQSRVTVPLEVYDAGTDDGLSFGSADLAALAPAAIGTLTSAEADTDFRQGRHRSTGSTIGSFRFERLA